MKLGLAEILLLAGIALGVILAGRAGRMKRMAEKDHPPRRRARHSDADELAKLAWLYENGKLTKKEYERQKKKILRKPF